MRARLHVARSVVYGCVAARGRNPVHHRRIDMAPIATTRLPIIGLATIALLAGLAPAPARSQATFVVNSALDENDAAPGDGACASASAVCTLRAAITEANALPGTDVVQLAAVTYALTATGSSEDQNVSGDLDIRSDIAIHGDPLGTTTITAAGLTNQRVVDVPVLASVTLRHVTLTGALLTSSGTAGAGAGLRVMAGATALVEDCRVTGNTTAGEGAGIYAGGAGTVVTVLRSTVSNNTGNGATSFGGGLRTASGAGFNVIESTVSGNSSTAAGGGLNHGTATGTVLIERSTFSGNTAASANTGGGAASFGGPGRVVNSTFSGNTVTHPTPGVNQGGGAFWISPLNASVVVDIEGSTIAGNNAVHSGGGIRRQGSSGALNVRATIIADNALASDTATARRDMIGNVNLAGFALVEDNTGYNATETQDPGTNVLGADPMLGPLADNGGPTQTHALASGSPAVNQGTCILMAGGTLDVDQRGAPREAPCDIGAIESGVVVAAPDRPASSELSMSVVRPNPAQARASFLLTAARGRHVVVTVHDMLGRTVAVPFDAVAPAAVTEVSLAVDHLRPGAYVVRATGPEDSVSRRFVIAR